MHWREYIKDRLRVNIMNRFYSHHQRSIMTDETKNMTFLGNTCEIELFTLNFTNECQIWESIL